MEILDLSSCRNLIKLPDLFEGVKDVWDSKCSRVFWRVDLFGVVGFELL